ncbi:class I SAM-dependent methyltransferase [Nostoc sp. ChiQUE01b]|uniref:class I SAM-dependent methyltransferase n=1 Tax=Nostoc sp. ChiQUE01b TaxID=3075376 RepID=UPI002AD2F297|nr:methyltransferase domain-containing protein [Nostoc sp. ChiQUE01b]MDZ8261975.1 methyltransferase domain-containing protein [Nostoc sp. ChiQUE01b]
MRENLPVKYSSEKYDEYTKSFVSIYDDFILQNLLEEYYQQGGGLKTLVDVGTGTAQILIKAAANPELDALSLIGTDYFQDMVDEARKVVKQNGLENRIEIINADVHNMPFPDNYADLVISRSTIHHWANPVRAFQEIYRILKPSGVAIIHDIRRNPGPEVLAEFNRLRQEIGVVPSNLEEKYTPQEVEDMLKVAGLTEYAVIAAPETGPGSLGFELRISK